MLTQKQPELLNIPFSKFLKLELPEFAERVISLVGEHNPEELKINELYDLLVAQQANIGKLVVEYGPHPITEELKTLREMRTLYVNSIEHQLKVVIKKNNSSTIKELRLVKIEINRFLGDLRSSKNDQTVNRKITQFLAAVATNEELDSAMSSLGFVDHMDNLNSVHVSIQKLTRDRLVSKSERPEETTAQLVKSVLTATKNLLKQIEIAPLKHTELDYDPLLKQLNELLIEYRDMINKRILFNKRKAEKLKNAENSDPIEETPTTEIPETEGKIFHLYTEEMEMNDLEKEPEQKKEKVVAMLSKTMQLPSDNDEA